MTLISAIICKDCIIIGSDSQATMNRGVPFKRLNYSKITNLDNSKFKVIIGGAGKVPFITKIIEEIQETCSESKVNNFNEIVKNAENAMLHLTRWFNFERPNELVPKNVPVNMPIIDGGKIGKEVTVNIQPLDVILIIAGYTEKGNPQIYIIHNEGLAEKQSNYGTIGSGSAYAESILSRCFFEDIICDEAIKITFYTIEEVMNLDPGVGGYTNISIIKKDKIQKLDIKQLEKIYKDITEFQDIEEDLLESYFKGNIRLQDLDNFVNKHNKSINQEN